MIADFVIHQPDKEDGGIPSPPNRSIIFPALTKAEGVGVIRALLGLAMIGFGILGVWDGVRDLIVPDQKTERPPARQFILTDVDGKRSSNVTLEILHAQLDMLAERGSGDGFHLQILPPVSDREKGELKLISCIYQDKITVIAFFEHSKEGIQVWREEPGQTEDVLRQVLEDRLDFSGWEKCAVAAQISCGKRGGWGCLLLPVPLLFRFLLQLGVSSFRGK